MTEASAAMFDVPVDAIYVWLGVAAVSVVTLGVVVAFPTTAPPQPTTVADAVDRIAVEPAGAHTTVRIEATEMRLGSQRIALRNDGGSASAAFAYGPVTPAVDDDRLELLLYGHPPAGAFESVAAFRDAVEDARTTSEWRPAPETIEVRRIHWEGTDVTLVG